MKKCALKIVIFHSKMLVYQRYTWRDVAPLRRHGLQSEQRFELLESGGLPRVVHAQQNHAPLLAFG